MKTSFAFVLAVLSVGAQLLLAQSDVRSGFVITLAKDTVRGQVPYRIDENNYQSCLFQGETGETEYGPDQILGFGYDQDKLFVSQIAG